MSRSPLALWLLAPCLALFAFLTLGAHRAAASAEPGKVAERSPDAALEVAASDAPTATLAPSPAAAQPVLGPMAYDAHLGRYTASYGAGRASLTISPRLQQGLEKLLTDYRVPVGAAVLLEPGTGRVLALAEHSERGAHGHVALSPVAPAASVFKIVTSAALLEKGLTPEQEVCFHGGRHRIQKTLLTDNPRRDRMCLTLASALGKSANVVFAKMAGRELSADLLRAEADKLLFDAAIPFEWPVEPSPAHISDDPFEFATTAAGFGPVKLSPLHGALLAAIVANGGKFVAPHLVDTVEGGPAPAAAPQRTVLRPEVAAALSRMMQTTTTEGTARKIFRRDRVARRSPLREVTVAGKTGSLAASNPYQDYSWFVGFAPVEDPQVAVAAVVVNERLWRIKASLVAHEALKAYFEAEGGRVVRTAAR